VPVENLVGRAWVRYWPLADMSVLQSGSPSVNTARAASVGAPDQP